MSLIQGKGIWTYRLNQVPTAPFPNWQAAIDALAGRIASNGFSHAVVLAAQGTGPAPFGGRTVRLVRTLHDLGVNVWGWHFIYGRRSEDTTNTRPLDEARVAVDAIRNFQFEGYVANAECHYEWSPSDCSGNVEEDEATKRAEARRFMTELRRLLRAHSLAHIPVALSSFKFPQSSKFDFPWQEFLEACDYNMPQLYWLLATQPADACTVVERGVTEHWSLANANPAAVPVRPIIPTGVASSDNPATWQPTNVQETTFLDRVRDRGGAPGANDPFLAAANMYVLANPGRDADALPTNMPVGSRLWDTIAGYDWPHPEPSPGQTLPRGSTEAGQVGAPTGKLGKTLMTQNHNGDVAFGSETSPAAGNPDFMAPEVSDRLDELVRMVQAEWPDLPVQSLKVVHAWMSAGAPDEAGGQSTHYEGRALHLTFEPAADQRVRRLAHLAANAGFGWVSHVAAAGSDPAAVHASTRDTHTAWTFKDGDRDAEAAAEAALWAEVEGAATAAVGFWVAFLGARADNLDATALSQRLLPLVRAVSWASSRHGSEPLDPPAAGAVRDPLRIADAGSPFWKQLCGSADPGTEPAGRQVVRPSPTAYFSRAYNLPELPAAVEAVPTRQRIDPAATGPFVPLFPVESLIFQMRNKFRGRLDPGFHAGMSYLWGTLWLLQQVNGTPNLPVGTGATYDCGPADWPRLIGGAVLANGGRTVGFPVRLRRALFDILAPKSCRIPITRVNPGVFEGRADPSTEVVAEYHGAFGTGCWCPRAGQYGGRAPGETAPRDAALLFARPGTNILAVVAGELSYVDDGPLGLFARIEFVWSELGSNEVWAFSLGPLSEAVGGPRTVGLGEVIGISGGTDSPSLQIKLGRVKGDDTSPPFVNVDPILALSWDNLPQLPPLTTKVVVYDDYSSCSGCPGCSQPLAAPANVNLDDSDLGRAEALEALIRWVVRHIDGSKAEGRTAAEFMRRLTWCEARSYAPLFSEISGI